MRTSHYLGDHRALVVTNRGDRMYVDTRDIMISPGILCYGDWEPETTVTLEKFLKPGMTWVDVGANIGYFTVIGHKLVRGAGGRTFAFEANPATFNFVSDNVRLNWFFEGVTCEPKAVFSKSTRLQFGAPTKYAVNASINAVQADFDVALDTVETFEVEAVSLDDYFGSTHIDFIKVDVEGAEEFVLAGGRQLFSRLRDITLLIEWSPGQMSRCGSSPQALCKEICDQGFHMWVAEGHRRKVTAEELLAIPQTTMILLSRNSGAGD